MGPSQGFNLRVIRECSIFLNAELSIGHYNRGQNATKRMDHKRFICRSYKGSENKDHFNQAPSFTGCVCLK